VTWYSTRKKQDLELNNFFRENFTIGKNWAKKGWASPFLDLATTSRDMAKIQKVYKNTKSIQKYKNF